VQVGRHGGDRAEPIELGEHPEFSGIQHINDSYSLRQ